jgi:hypothetical protein
MESKLLLHWSTRMPANAKRSKTTFRIAPDVLAKFQKYIDELGLRRDKYLNMILPSAIWWLGQAKKNSPTAEKFWKSIRDVRGNSLQKVAVLLDSDVLADLNAVCADKRIPRDQFFQTFLECLITVPVNGNGPAPLPAALSLIENPWEQWSGSQDETPFDHIIMPGFTEDDLLEVLKDSGLPRA